MTVHMMLEPLSTLGAARKIQICPMPPKVDDWVSEVAGRPGYYEQAYHWAGGTVYIWPNRVDFIFNERSCQIHVGTSREKFVKAWHELYPWGDVMDYAKIRFTRHPSF